MPAQRERGTDHRWNGKTIDLLEGCDDLRQGNAQPARLDGTLELLAILGAPDDLDGSSDQLDSEVVEDAAVGEGDREVERGLPAECRQERVRPLAGEHRGDALEVERLDVRAVREAGVGHDRRGVGVDDDGAVAVLAQHLQRLAAGVVELASLADHDRPGTDYANRGDVTASG